MKKVKKVCRIIITFAFFMGISVLPTLMFRTDEINLLFGKPEYWVITVIIAAVITWQLEQANNSEK